MKKVTQASPRRANTLPARHLPASLFNAQAWPDTCSVFRFKFLWPLEFKH